MPRHSLIKFRSRSSKGQKSRTTSDLACRFCGRQEATIVDYALTSGSLSDVSDTNSCFQKI